MDMFKISKLSSITALLIIIALFCSACSESTEADIELDMYYKNVYSIANTGYDLTAKELAEQLNIGEIKEDSSSIVDSGEETVYVTVFKSVSVICIGRKCDLVLEETNKKVSRATLEFPFEVGLFDEIRNIIISQNGEPLINDFSKTQVSIWKKSTSSLSLERREETIYLEFINSGN